MQQLDSKQSVVSGTSLKDVKGHHDWLVMIWKLVTSHVMLMYNRVSVLTLPETTVRNAVVNNIPFAFNTLTAHTNIYTSPIHVQIPCLLGPFLLDGRRLEAGQCATGVILGFPVFTHWLPIFHVHPASAHIAYKWGERGVMTVGLFVWTFVLSRMGV